MIDLLISGSYPELVAMIIEYFKKNTGHEISFTPIGGDDQNVKVTLKGKTIEEIEKILEDLKSVSTQRKRVCKLNCVKE